MPFSYLWGKHMGTWFDNLAKRSARSSGAHDLGSEVPGLTRRQVLVRGAVVGGAAWTAPMLLGVRPAFAGASQCPGEGDASTETQYTDCMNGTFECCQPGDVCGTFPDGSVGCDTPLGGICGNRGAGVDTCNFGRSRCNQVSSDQDAEPTCGGTGAPCDSTIDGQVCVDGVACSDGTTDGDERCGGQGAACDGSEDCSPRRTTGLPVTTCVDGICTA